jgi:ubiquinone/menaquinone biosynthesis C-methylase UbiE
MDPDRQLIDEQIAYYRARAAEYDATSTPEGDPFAAHADRIRAALRSSAPRGRVLELAAGTGQWTGILHESADDLLVTDASPEMLELNRSRMGDWPNVRY